MLNPQERPRSPTAAKARQEQVGWRIVDDPRHRRAARHSRPSRCRTSTPGQAGTRWSSAQGQVQVETFRIRSPAPRSRSVFEQQKQGAAEPQGRGQPAADDFFIAVGHAGAEEVLRARRDQGRRGARHDGALRPGHRRHHGSGGGRDVERLRAVSGQLVAGAGGPPPRRKVEYGTGIVGERSRPHPHRPPADRRAAMSSWCAATAMPTRVAEDEPPTRAAARLRRAALCCPRRSSDGARGARPHAGRHRRSAERRAAARGLDRNRASSMATGVLEPAPPLGFSGAAALDAQGRFFGMVGLKPRARGRRQPAHRPQAAVVPADTIRSFLDERTVHASDAAPGVKPPRPRWCA